MTVGELIERLKAYPADVTVLIVDGNPSGEHRDELFWPMDAVDLHPKGGKLWVGGFDSMATRQFEVPSPTEMD